MQNGGSCGGGRQNRPPQYSMVGAAPIQATPPAVLRLRVRVMEGNGAQSGGTSAEQVEHWDGE